MTTAPTMMMLGLELSSARGSLALGAAGAEQIHWQADFPAGRGHGGELFQALAEAMEALRASGERLGMVVVGLGPGSYSGVRQAVAAATGLAMARGAGLRGRPSSEAFGTDAPEFHAVGDARRGFFYHATVRAGRCAQGPDLLSHEETLARLSAQPDWPVLAGEDAPALASLSTTRPVLVCPPDAARLLRGAADLPEPGGPLAPIYLRPPSITRPKGQNDQ